MPTPLPLPKGYQRLDPFPIDSTGVFTNYVELTSYASTNATAYPGQIVSLSGEDTAYIIKSDLSVEPVNIDPAIYAHAITGSNRNLDSYCTTIQQFIGSQWSSSLNLQRGDTISLSASSVIYMLKYSDGSSVNHYTPTNIRANRLFYKLGVADYSQLDTFPLSSIKSAKYVIQVEDTSTNDIFFCELNLISNGVVAIATEYGSNYTSSIPFVEFGGFVINETAGLSAIGIEGYDMSNFMFKGVRISFF